MKTPVKPHLIINLQSFKAVLFPFFHHPSAIFHHPFIPIFLLFKRKRPFLDLGYNHSPLKKLIGVKGVYSIFNRYLTLRLSRFARSLSFAGTSMDISGHRVLPFRAKYRDARKYPSKLSNRQKHSKHRSGREKYRDDRERSCLN